MSAEPAFAFSPAATTPKMRLRVDVGKDESSKRLLVPVDGSSTVAQFARSVEERELKRRRATGETPVRICGIQLRVEDSLCEVDPDDVLSDLVPNDGQSAVFVAVCMEDIRVPASASTHARSEGATPAAPATPDTAVVSRAGTAPASPKTTDHANRPDHPHSETAATDSEASAPPPQSILFNVNDSPSLQRQTLPPATASTPPAANGSSNTGSDSNAYGLDRTAIDVLSARIQSSFNADVYGPRIHSGGGGGLPASISLPPVMLSPVPSTEPSTAEGPAFQPSESGTRHSTPSIRGNASATSSEPRSEAAGRGKGRGRRRTRRDSAGKTTSAAEGGVSAPKDSSSVAKDSVLPGRATGMMASLMMGGDPLVKKAAAAGFAPASGSIPSGFGPFGVGDPSFLGPGAAAAAAAMAAAANAAARHHHHRTHPSPLLCQPWSPQPWHGGNPHHQQQQQQQQEEQQEEQDGGTTLPSSPPTEEQATAASRAAATAMAAAKVQLLGLPWRAFGGHLVGPEGDPSSGKLRRPSDHRATAAAAAALAGLGGGQWGRGEFAKHPTLAQDLYSYPYPGAKFCPPGVISPPGAISPCGGMATNSPGPAPPLNSSTKLAGAKLAAAVVNASVTKAIGYAGGEGAGAARTATSAAPSAAGAGSGLNDSELAVDVDVGGGSGDIPKGVAESGTLSVASESAAASAGAPAPLPPPEKPRYEAPVRQWQAAEKYIMNAFMLQTSEPPDKQAVAKAFFADLASKTKEPPGPVIALVRTAVQPAPWGSGYMVASRRQLTNLCQSAGTPMGFDCLTRLLLGRSFPSGGSLKVDAPRIRKCFSALAAQIGNHPDRGPLDYHALGVGRCVFTLRHARVAALERAATASGVAPGKAKTAAAQVAAEAAAAAAAAAAATSGATGSLESHPSAGRSTAGGEHAPFLGGLGGREDFAAPGDAASANAAAEAEVDVDVDVGGAEEDSPSGGGTSSRASPATAFFPAPPYDLSLPNPFASASAAAAAAVAAAADGSSGASDEKAKNGPPAMPGFAGGNEALEKEPGEQGSSRGSSPAAGTSTTDSRTEKMTETETEAETDMVANHSRKEGGDNKT